MRHEARLNRLAKDGVPERAHLEAAAPRSAAARAALAGPECPECLEYLLEWAAQLYGRSGVGMDGAAPLSYATVEAWARLSGVDVSPHECEALMLIDAAMRNPGAPEPDEAEAQPARAWPTRKVG